MRNRRTFVASVLMVVSLVWVLYSRRHRQVGGEVQTQAGDQEYTYDFVVKGTQLTGTAKGNLLGESPIARREMDRRQDHLRRERQVHGTCRSASSTRGPSSRTTRSSPVSQRRRLRHGGVRREREVTSMAGSLTHPSECHQLGSRTLRLSGSPTQLTKEARSWRVRSKRCSVARRHQGSPEVG